LARKRSKGNITICPFRELIINLLYMTAAQFDLLSMKCQEELVINAGVLLAIRQEPEFIIHLYQLDSFYIEFFYHQVRKSPVSIRSFTHTKGLDPYLTGMDLGFI
jgi:hypothetical protein